MQGPKDDEAHIRAILQSQIILDKALNNDLGIEDELAARLRKAGYMKKGQKRAKSRTRRAHTLNTSVSKLSNTIKG